MVHAGMKALLDSKECRKTKVLAIFDNEEVGSGTKQGAGSPVLRTIIERIVFNLGGGPEDLYRAIHNSFMISADMAHALHPNYAEKHDPTNHPLMNEGPVIKINANQKYVTDGDSASCFPNNLSPRRCTLSNIRQPIGYGRRFHPRQHLTLSNGNAGSRYR